MKRIAQLTGILLLILGLCGCTPRGPGDVPGGGKPKRGPSVATDYIDVAGTLLGDWDYPGGYDENGTYIGEGGFYNENGDWVGDGGYDRDGTWIGVKGYFDKDGNWIGPSGGHDSQGNFVGLGGMYDAEGNYVGYTGFVASGPPPPRPDENATLVPEGEFDLVPVYFGYDQATIPDSQFPALDAIVAFLEANPQQNVLVEGHCDERGSKAYNLALGERRAQAIRNFLIHKGVDPVRVSTSSYGSEMPAEPGHTESSWSKNRRAEFKFSY